MPVTRVAVPDGDAPAPPAFDRLVADLIGWLRGGDTVLVHCQAGIGRSATVACAVLMAMGYPLTQAFEIVRERRPVVSPTDRQLAALRDFEARAAARA